MRFHHCSYVLMNRPIGSVYPELRRYASFFFTYFYVIYPRPYCLCLDVSCFGFSYLKWWYYCSYHDIYSAANSPSVHLFSLPPRISASRVFPFSVFSTTSQSPVFLYFLSPPLQRLMAFSFFENQYSYWYNRTDYAPHIAPIDTNKYTHTLVHSTSVNPTLLLSPHAYHTTYAIGSARPDCAQFPTAPEIPKLDGRSYSSTVTTWHPQCQSVGAYSKPPRHWA